MELIALEKRSVKVKQCENPLGLDDANWETCQIPMCLSHELIKSKKEYWIKFRFGYFIIHFKSRLLTPMQLPTSNFIRGKKT